MQTKTHRTIIVFLIAALSIATLFGCIELGKRIAYEMAGPFNGDSTIYWAVGRGILNGLTPYRDLFETKPPGIFLLSSFSLWLTDSLRLGSFLQALVFLLIPLTIALGVARIHRKRPWKYQVILVLFSVCFGIVLSLYTAERSGEFQVESFGALAVCLYALVLAWNPHPLGLRRILLASLFLFCAIGLKEPFALSALAVALLLAHHPKELLRSFVYPALIVGITGTSVMLLLGYLDPYIHIYLPEMLGKHIHAGQSLWERGLLFHVVLNDMSAYSPVLMQLIVTLLIGTTFIRLFTHTGLRGALYITSSQAAAAYLLVLAVGIGGAFWNHHFVFAVPGYVALFLLYARELHKHWLQFGTRFVVLTLALLTIASMFEQPTHDYEGRLASLSVQETIARNNATFIDTTLDACGIDRYLFLGANGSQPFGYTTHSPIGPLFLQYDYWLSEERPEFRAQMLSAVEQSFFVVDHIHLHSLTNNVQQYLNDNFSTQPWDCAQNIAQARGYKFLYRKKM